MNSLILISDDEIDDFSSSKDLAISPLTR